MDSRHGRRIRGWALERGAEHAALYIDVILDGELIASEPADIERVDLAAIGWPTRHGFDFRVDLDLDHCDAALAIVARRGDRAPDVTAKTNLRFSWKRDAAVPAPTRPPPASPGPGAIFLDISDLISFLRVHNYVTGIQRVVSGLIGSIAAGGDPTRGDVHFAMTARGEGDIRIFQIEPLLALIGMAVAGGLPQAGLTAAVEELEATSQRYRPKPGDLYFITGAYWIVEDFSQRLARLRENGIIIGLYVYDLIPITHGQYVAEATRRDVVDRAVDFLLIVDFCFTISAFVRREVEALVAIELGRRLDVEAAPLPHQMNAPKPTDAVAPERADPGPFVLCVGTLEGRKNHVLLFRVWSALIRKHGRDRVPDLVLVGKWGWNIEAFRDLCHASNFLGGKIRVLADAGDGDLIHLYGTCLFSVYPSMVEGWGLPVGESLFHGKLCLASNRSSIPEVGGDHCVYFDPHDFFDAFAAIERYIFDAAARAAREREIRETFRPRTWAMFTRDLLAAMRETRNRAATRERLALYPSLVRDTVYALRTPVSGGAETIPWLAKQVKFMREGAWGRIEDWGCWAQGRKVQLRFGIEPARATPIRLYLELRLPPGIGTGSKIALRCADGPATVLALESEPAWYRVDVPPPADGVVVVGLDASFRPLIEDDRDIYFGLSRLFCVQPASDADDLVPLRVVQSLSGRTLPGDALVRRPDVAEPAEAAPRLEAEASLVENPDAMEEVSMVGAHRLELWTR